MIIYVLYYLIYWGINAYICIYFLQMPKYLMLASSVAALLASGAAGLDESHLALKKKYFMKVTSNMLLIWNSIMFDP